MSKKIHIILTSSGFAIIVHKTLPVLEGENKAGNPTIK